jgi:cyclic pyranopterin phosphate synthase
LNHITPFFHRSPLASANSPLQDSHGRKINYLRLSVTDRCDFRCTYCMSEQIQFLPRGEILALEECLLIAKAFVGLGVDKIRLSGGEPLVRKNFPWLVAQLRKLDGLRELTMTTNGSQLAQYAAPLVCAGLDRINISVDSLNPDTFTRITRGGDLRRVLAGVDAAITAFGAARVKLNIVMQRGVNHAELPALLAYALSLGADISFIEQMPLGKTLPRHADTFYGSDEARGHLGQQYELIPSVESTGGPARYWRIAGHGSRIGFISPHTHNFCAACNRMRVSARGELFPCLGKENMTDLLHAVRARDEVALSELIVQAVAAKPQAHEFDLSEQQPTIVRFMSHTGG